MKTVCGEIVWRLSNVSERVDREVTSFHYITLSTKIDVSSSEPSLAPNRCTGRVKPGRFSGFIRAPHKNPGHSRRTSENWVVALVFAYLVDL